MTITHFGSSQGSRRCYIMLSLFPSSIRSMQNISTIAVNTHSSFKFQPKSINKQTDSPAGGCTYWQPECCIINPDSQPGHELLRWLFTTPASFKASPQWNGYFFSHTHHFNHSTKVIWKHWKHQWEIAGLPGMLCSSISRLQASTGQLPWSRWNNWEFQIWLVIYWEFKSSWAISRWRFPQIHYVSRDPWEDLSINVFSLKGPLIYSPYTASKCYFWFKI